MILLVHYKDCGLRRKVECSLCGYLQDRKALADHMRDECEKRVLECVFCDKDVEAWEKQTRRMDMALHELGSIQHNAILVDEIDRLKEENKQPPAPASTAEALVVPSSCWGCRPQAEHPATTSAEPVENVVTGAVGTGPASSSPAPLARTTPEFIESMNSGGPTRTPSLPVPQVATKKPAATSGTNPRGGCRMDTMSVPPDLSDEDMDTSASQPAQQAQNERRSTFGCEKKPPHRTTGPKQDSLT
ncbi:hypothetical protein HPB48_003561 [Haemaphysalis longicornis]|uniref:TRAF-type domain-containing protein n=1 Tax=Haemaphysalis longicornis TaxID=44386 RepID=A0A9J6FQ00_HAELO|nr:hypothetical protein HPB48_003561 [Haemaphysalis longicornis]